jgi:hypothetical protein
MYEVAILYFLFYSRAWNVPGTCLERASVKHASPLQEQPDHARVIPAQNKEGCRSCASKTE